MSSAPSSGEFSQSAGTGKVIGMNYLLARSDILRCAAFSKTNFMAEPRNLEVMRRGPEL